MTALCVAKYENSKKNIHSKKYNCSVISCLTNAGPGILKRPHVYVDIDTCSKELNNTQYLRNSIHMYSVSKYADIVSTMCNGVFYN